MPSGLGAGRGDELVLPFSEMAVTHAGGELPRPRVPDHRRCGHVTLIRSGAAWETGGQAPQHVKGHRETLVSPGRRLAPGGFWAQSLWLYSFIEPNEPLGFENRKHFEVLGSAVFKQVEGLLNSHVWV